MASPIGKAAPSLALLAAVTAIAFSALHIVVPVLPVLVRVFGADPPQVQWVLSLYLLGIAAGQLVYGPVSDRFGRRPVLLAGLVMFLAGTALCGVAWSLAALIAGRLLQACGACAGTVLGRAIIRDVYDREAAARGLALVMMAMTLAPAVSPAIGAFLAEWVDWRAIFAVLGLLGAVVLGFTWARLPETNPGRSRLDLLGMSRSYIGLLRSPAFLAYALCSACTSASWFTFCAGAPYVVTEGMHRGPETYGIMILLPMLAYVVGNGITARFALILGSTRLFIVGLALSLASGAMMAVWCLFDANPWALFVPISLSSIGNGMSQPPALAAALSINPRVAGAASGVTGFLQMAVSALGSVAIGLLPHDSALALVAVVGGCQVAAVLLAVPVVRTPASSSAETGRIATAEGSSG